MDGASGVAASISTEIIKVRLNNRQASAPAFSSRARIAPVRQTNQLATNDRKMPPTRTPNGVSPNSTVPARMTKAMAGG